MTQEFIPQGGEFLVNTHTTGDQGDPSIIGLADGGYVVTWEADGQDGSGLGIYAQRYNANGATVGAEFQINTYTTGDQGTPSITALADGGFVVAWHSAQDGNALDVFAQRYNASGVAVGTEFLINTHVASWQQVPSITALSDGGFVVTWDSWDQDVSGIGIFGQRFGANGVAAGAEFQINTYTTGHQSGNSVTALSNGGFVVTWKSDAQDSSGSGVYGQRYNANGATVGAEFQINTHVTLDQDTPSITGLDDGGFVVAWQSAEQDSYGYGIYGQRYNANGVAAGAEFQINTYTTIWQISPTTTALADGGFVVSWESDGQDGSGYGVYGQRYDAGGGVVGAEFQISTFTPGHQREPSITGLEDGGFVVAWRSSGQDGDGNGIYAQQFQAQLFGTAGDDNMLDMVGANWMNGLAGDDLLNGLGGDDTIYGGDGQDTLIGRSGNDTLIGGTSVDDLRDTIYGGNGNDVINGGYGNDELRGDAGDDTIDGGFGGDRVIGGTGNDTLGGGALGDELFGGDGIDFINGGWGHDRVNGGADGDRFYHLGIADHGADWIQDYTSADGDVLLWGGGAATADDFLVQVAETTNAGVAGVEEVFVTHIPSGNLLWALVDGDAQDEINIQIAGQVYDLLG